MESERLVELGRRAKALGEHVYLATVVHVKGSSYRKPGARMLVTSGGERSGTISGGCLEAEVSRKIAWLTDKGTALQKYRSSFDEEGEAGFGLGCDGEVWVLLEAEDAVDRTMNALEGALLHRQPAVLVLSFGTNAKPQPSAILAAEPLRDGLYTEMPEDLLESAARALQKGCAVETGLVSGVDFPEYICLPIKPATRLHVFGAGEDAEPIVRFAAELGWEVCVSDGRANLLRKEHFPRAKQLIQLSYGVDKVAQKKYLQGSLCMEEEDCAVILTHSYEQDRALLKQLLQAPISYLGVLGPLRRTRRLVAEIADEIGLTQEECLARLHAPVGLNMGTHDPAVIALSIVVEIQAGIAGKSITVESSRSVSMSATTQAKAGITANA